MKFLRNSQGSRPITLMEGVMKILIVDDEQLLREMMALTIKRAVPEAIVVTAESAEDALAEMAKCKPGDSPIDLVITDGNMGGMSGPLMLQVMRRKGWNIPAILITGTIWPEDEIKNFVNVMIKPCPMQDLINAVKQAIKAS